MITAFFEVSQVLVTAILETPLSWIHEIFRKTDEKETLLTGRPHEKKIKLGGLSVSFRLTMAVGKTFERINKVVSVP